MAEEQRRGVEERDARKQQATSAGLGLEANQALRPFAINDVSTWGLLGCGLRSFDPSSPERLGYLKPREILLDLPRSFPVLYLTLQSSCLALTLDSLL
jgi:hypothetical protein